MLIVCTQWEQSCIEFNPLALKPFTSLVAARICVSSWCWYQQIYQEWNVQKVGWLDIWEWGDHQWCNKGANAKVGSWIACWGVLKYSCTDSEKHVDEERIWMVDIVPWLIICSEDNDKLTFIYYCIIISIPVVIKLQWHLHMHDHGCGGKGTEWPVLIIRFICLHDLNNESIQRAIVLSSGVFLCHKTNMTFIRAITVDGVTCDFIWNCHPQIKMNANSIVRMIVHQWVAAAKWMQNTVTPIIMTKSQQEQFVPFMLLLGFLSVCLSLIWCVVCFLVFCCNLTTSQNWHVAGNEEKLIMHFLVSFVPFKHGKNMYVKEFSLVFPLHWCSLWSGFLVVAWPATRGLFQLYYGMIVLVTTRGENYENHTFSQKFY